MGDGSQALAQAEAPPSVHELFDRGLYLQALRQAKSQGLFSEPCGPDGMCLGHRILCQTGGSRAGLRLLIRVRRRYPDHFGAHLLFGYEVLRRRGPLAALTARRAWRATEPVTDDRAADLAALDSQIYSGLRDFRAADAALAEAEARSSRSPWVQVCRSMLLEQQDRVEEALECAVAGAALHPHPFYRAAVQQQSRLLQMLGRSEEALRLLQTASDHLESAAVVVHWIEMLKEAERWEESLAALGRLETLAQEHDFGFRRWISAQLALVLHRLGRREEAAGHARRCGDPFHDEYASRLEGPRLEPDRVRWDVPFVRQDFKTCAPATLAALGRYWGMPADHVALAEAICYDGTPGHLQRSWATEHGWYARDFRVTWEAAVELLRRGVPFALATVETTSAHLQAVVGFDVTRGTLLLRDPSRAQAVEVIAAGLLERYQAYGPRGTVFLPAGEVQRLEGLELPDAEACDARYELDVALARHDRVAAVGVLARLEAREPKSLQVLHARLDLAAYDGNAAAALPSLTALLELFPGHPGCLLRKFSCLGDRAREARLALLTPAADRLGAEPALLVARAGLLLADAREHEGIPRLLDQALRRSPGDSGAYRTLADYHWALGRHDRAIECYWFAACLEGFQEWHFQVWFQACRHRGEAGPALEVLQERFRRFGSRSAQPALTLAWAQRELDRPDAARATLAEALQLRPEDGQLHLRSASLHAALGLPEEAATFLESARGRTREVEWLRTAAEMAEARLDHAETLRLAEAWLERDPLALDAHQMVLRTRQRFHGARAAFDHLAEVTARFPDHMGLRRLQVEASRLVGPDVLVEVASRLVADYPTDAWARRELAAAWLRLDRVEEARVHAEEARAMEPTDSGGLGLLGEIEARRGAVDRAKEHYRAALVQDADNTHALGGWLGLAVGDDERRAVMDALEEQIERQPMARGSLLRYREQAAAVLPSDRILGFLRRVHGARPDTWQARSALIHHLVWIERKIEALELARGAVGRFPHVPQVWEDLASVHRSRREGPEELAVAREAFERHSGAPELVFLITDALERSGLLEESRSVTERALRHSPHDARLHGVLAHLLQRAARPEEALKALEQALKLNPSFSWAWNLFHQIAVGQGQAPRVLDFARELTAQVPGEVGAWVMLARVLAEQGRVDECLEATDRARTLAPQDQDAWDLRAEVLADTGRFDDAVATCTAGLAVPGANRMILEGRLAWIDARRGEWAAAIVRIRALLEVNRGYLWGWRQLAHWSSVVGDFEEAEAALRQGLSLAPQDAGLHVQLGVTLLQRDKKTEAAACFAEALRLEPTHAAAARQLFQTQFDNGQYEAADATLAVIRVHHPGSLAFACEARLALRRGDVPSAVSSLALLVQLPDPDPWPVQVVTEGFREMARASEALAVLEPLVGTTGGSPELPAATIRLLLALDRRRGAVKAFLRSATHGVDAEDRAAVALAGGLGRLGDAPFHLRRALSRRREVFRRTDGAWAEIGFAMLRMGRYKAACEWLSDWRVRRDIEPWMLHNLVIALRHEGHYGAAAEVARHGVSGLHRQEGLGGLHLFLAIEEAVQGKPEPAAEHLTRSEVRSDVPLDRLLHAIAQALVTFLTEPAEERVRAFGKAKQSLDLLLTSRHLRYGESDLRRTVSRAAACFAREGAGWRARLWGFSRLYHAEAVFAGCAVLALLAAPVLSAPLLILLAVRLLLWIGDKAVRAVRS